MHNIEEEDLSDARIGTYYIYQYLLRVSQDHVYRALCKIKITRSVLAFMT